MWDKKMAAEKPKIESKHEKSNMPWLRLLFSILIILVALNNFFNWVSVTDLVTNILLLISGVWILIIIILETVYHSRAETLKKYI